MLGGCAMAFEGAGGAIQAICSVVNPDKLGHVGPLPTSRIWGPSPGRSLERRPPCAAHVDDLDSGVSGGRLSAGCLVIEAPGRDSRERSHRRIVVQVEARGIAASVFRHGPGRKGADARVVGGPRCWTRISRTAGGLALTLLVLAVLSLRAAAASAATTAVSTLADALNTDGLCSLREAITVETKCAQ